MSSVRSDEGYCKPLDLTCRIPGYVVDAAFSSGQLWSVEVDPGLDRHGILHRLEEKLKVESAPTRICVPSLGSPKWGDLAGQVNTTTVFIDHTHHISGHSKVFVLSQETLASIPEWLCQHSFTPPSFVRGVGRISVDTEIGMDLGCDRSRVCV
jgi:hypothetical protein